MKFGILTENWRGSIHLFPTFASSPELTKNKDTIKGEKNLNTNPTIVFIWVLL